MIKRYPLKLVKVYRYTDPETGEQDDLLFIANGALFPLFKSLSGVELGDALAEYKKSILGVLTPESRSSATHKTWMSSSRPRKRTPSCLYPCSERRRMPL